MKEATGEANMTVVTIIIIAVIVAIGVPIVTGLMNGISKKACAAEGGTWDSTNSECSYGSGSES